MTRWHESPPDELEGPEPDDEDIEAATEKLADMRRIHNVIGLKFVAQDDEFFAKVYEESETLRQAFTRTFEDDIASLASEYALDRAMADDGPDYREEDEL